MSDLVIDSDEENDHVKGELHELESTIKNAKAGKKRKDEDVISDPNPHETPQKEILWAACKGKLDLVTKLLSTNSSLVNSQDNDGYTPLHRACYSNHLEIVKVLLAHGADVGARTADLWTPLHSASKWNNVECVLQLIAHGADVNATTDGGQTPLHLATTHPTAKDLLFLLLNHPAMKVDYKNKNGETAKDLAHRSCKYYKIFEICDKNVNCI